MSFCQNEFIYLVNAYYQAYAYYKNYKATGIFGLIEIQPELSELRDMLSVDLSNFKPSFDHNDSKGKSRNADLVIVKSILIETHSIPNWFVDEIESSVESFIHNSNSDMTEYRLIFQMGSDVLYGLVHLVINEINDDFTAREKMTHIVHSIINEDHWKGEELISQIDLVRRLSTSLFFTEKWICEYAFKMLYH